MQHICMRKNYCKHFFNLSDTSETPASTWMQRFVALQKSLTFVEENGPFFHLS